MVIGDAQPDGGAARDRAGRRGLLAGAASTLYGERALREELIAPKAHRGNAGHLQHAVGSVPEMSAA